MKAKTLNETEVFEKYLKLPLWTIHESAYLLSGMNPSPSEIFKTDIDDRYNDLDIEGVEDFENFIETIIRAAYAGKIKSMKTSEGEFLVVDSVIDWAIKNEYISNTNPLYQQYKTRISKNIKYVPSEEQIDRISCSAIAQALWYQDSEISLEEMIVRDEVRRFGNGKLYEDETVIKWIKEFCPNKPKRGRPPKKK